MYVVKVPGINGLGKTQGCEKAGNAILKMLKEQVHSKESGEAIEFEKLELEEIHLNNDNIELSNELIYKNSFKAFETKPRTVFLGGDHSVSYSLVRGFFDYCQNSSREPCLIVFDAHPDLMEPMQEPTHEEWLRRIIEEGFPAENILLVGVRNSWKTETDYLKEKGIRTISINDLRENLSDFCHAIMEFSSGKELYVSLDMDVVDPAFAPAVYYKEPGGLSSREILYIFQRINKVKKLRGVDIVEVNPDKDALGLTVKLGAEILSELI